ncbi:MAG: thioredoxin-like domain-containing protein [Flavobacteriaceae bacterium]|nr:hypothetical protein [Flavobacteriaceae bacterium]
MRRLLLTFSIFILLFNCKPETDSSCGQAFIGGEIVNPVNDHLVLYDDTSPIDTLYLDKDNRFSYNIETLSPGLHSFIHGGEYQIIVLEPNDSIMLRLNTLDFDESLVFTGRGSKKNNYLINLYNTLDGEDKIVYEVSKFEPIKFLKVIDSLKAEKIASLNKFNEKYENSPLFNKVALASINYSYSTHKELYPFRYFGRHEIVNRSSLPANFYDYRADIDYNDDVLKDFYPYYNFLFPHFNNLALDRYFELTQDSVFNRNSIVYNLNKLDLMNEMVSNKDIKNNLLKYATRNFLSYNNSDADCDAMYDSFLSKSTNEEHSEYITSLYNTIKKLRPGNKFPDIEVINYKNEVTNIDAMFNKPTVIYFWSHAIKDHFKNSHNKVAELKEKYPNINFISININADKPTMWKRLLNQNNFPLQGEYRFRDAEAAKKILAIQYINKVMVIDKNNRIITSNANMFSSDFKELLDFL